jgi:hypothetical protein
MVRTAFTLAALILSALASGPAGAGAALEARYVVTFTSVTLGQGVLVVEVSEEGYSAAGSAMVAGLLQMVTGGKGSAAARGQFVGGRVLPISYSGSSENKERSQEVRLSGAAGTIKDVLVSPKRDRTDSDRVPLTEEHRKNVVDPMSAAIMPVTGEGEVTGPDACNRTLPIFDGEYRYDLVFSFERNDKAKDVKGYNGPLAVCRVEYRPVAGHRANRKQVKDLSENRDIFVWLAPIADTRVVMPLRVSFGTKVGTFVVQATHFMSEPKANAAAKSLTR